MSTILYLGINTRNCIKINNIFICEYYLNRYSNVVYFQCISGRRYTFLKIYSRQLWEKDD